MERGGGEVLFCGSSSASEYDKGFTEVHRQAEHSRQAPYKSTRQAERVTQDLNILSQRLTEMVAQYKV